MIRKTEAVKPDIVDPTSYLLGGTIANMASDNLIKDVEAMAKYG